MSRVGKVFKRLAITLGVVVALLLAAIVIVPFVVNVDDYRPRIEKVVNDQVNGRLTLGKLQLSLWGHIQINVASFELADAQGRKLVGSNEVFFRVPFLSVLSGAPEITFTMRRPLVDVVKDKQGKLNLLSLIKTSAPGASAPPPSASAATSFPKMVTQARIGIELRDAHVAYKDELTGLTSEVNDLNVILKNITLSGKPMQIEVWANLDTRMGKSLVVRGPVKLTGTATPSFETGQFQKATLIFQASATDLEVTMPGLFEKKPGVVATADGDVLVSTTQAKINSLLLRFLNAEIKMSAEATELGTPPGPKITFMMQSNEFALKPWSALIPPLRTYDLSGIASLDANARGTASAPQYSANLAFKGVSAKAPMLKSEPHLEGAVKVSTDQIESLLVTMKAPGNDLRVTGKVVSFSKPKIDIQVQSTSMDLDQLVDFPAKPKAAAADAQAPAETDKTAPPADFDALLDPLRKNPTLAGVAATVKFDLALLKIFNMKMTGMIGQVSFRNLALALEGFRMGLWDGTIKAAMSAQLKPKMPTYHLSTEVTGLKLQNALATHMELLKNTLTGTANFKMEANGASFNPDPAKTNLNAKGNMKVDKANFATIDIGKMASEAVNKSLGDLGNKIPALKNQKIHPPNSIDSKFEFVSSDFTINGGRFNAPNFYAKAEKDHGIDIKGDTQLGLKDYALNAHWLLIDAYNLTKARDLSVNIGGVQVDHILADGNNPVQFPIVITGTALAPNPSYTAVPETLSKVALANIGKATTGKAKAEAQKQLSEQLKKVNAPAPIQNAVQDLGKKLFGH